MKRNVSVLGSLLCAGLALSCGGTSQAAEAESDQVVRIDRTLPAPSGTITGLAWGGDMLWAVDGPQGMVYSLDPETGSPVDSFKVSLNGRASATGLAYSQDHDLVFVGMWDGGTNGWVGTYSPTGENLNNVSMCGG